MFVIENLRYKNILNIPSLTLDRPITCITGPSGAGKSTLLRMLNRLLEPDCGTILYNGSPLSTLPPVQLRRQVTMLGQTPVLAGGTLAEELRLAADLCGYAPPDEQAMHKALRIVQLNKDLDDWCDTFSGGEKQRVCLARLLLTPADTYLLDEPTAALDKETEQAIVQALLHAAAEQKKTIVMVTHSTQIAQQLADGIVHMENGHAEGYQQ